MPTESIFHKVVKKEDSYTQLLYNLIKRDGAFRRHFLSFLVGQDLTKLLGEDLTKDATHAYIATQERLSNKGRADIYVKTAKLCLILEVKTEIHRDRTEMQLLSKPEKESSFARIKHQGERHQNSYMEYKLDSFAPRARYVVAEGASA